MCSSETDNITSAAVAGGCSTNINTAGTDCNAAPWNTSRFFTDSMTTFQSVTEPTADFAAYYSTARPGPVYDTCGGSSPLAASTFDNDGVHDGNDGTFNLTPATSYSCKSYDQNGMLVGELSWNSTSHALTIRGVIFIDGNVTMGDTQATYQGSASLYVGGTFTFTGNGASLCANATCDFTSWNPNTEMLLILANGSGNAITFSGNADRFQGGLFCNPTSTMYLGGNTIQIMGPIICG